MKPLRGRSGKNGKEETEGPVAGRETEADERKQKRNGKCRKEAEGKHLRTSCGSESGKGERKHTGSLSTGTGKKRTGNQAGENGEDRRSESESGALRKPL